MPYNPHDDKFTADPGREGTAADEHKLVLLTAAKSAIKIEFDYMVLNHTSPTPLHKLVIFWKSSESVKAYINACNNTVTAHWIIHRYICELLQAYICGRTFVPANAKEC